MSPKAGFMTPKAIANKIKAKGLQKLRWYCQMCNKQCRDENGFQCHLKSDSHMRQMALFGQNSEKIIGEYSRQFETTFLQHFRTAHRHTRMQASMLYNEFIADRHHVHMNSTKWVSLTAFVMYLGKTGKCKVEETDKGFFLTLLEKGDQEKLQGALKEKRKRAEEADEIRHAKALKAQVARAQKLAQSPEDDQQVTELNRGEMDAPLGFDLKAAAPGGQPAGSSLAQAQRAKNLLAEEDEESPQGMGSHQQGRKKTALDEIMAEQEASKKKKGLGQASSSASHCLSKRCWLAKGIVVKIMSKELKSSGFYKEKASVKKVLEQGGRHIGEVEHLKTGALIQVDQEQLETVIPKEGGRVLVLSGEHKGAKAKLLGVNTKKFQAEIEIEAAGRRRLWVEYDDVSKVSK